MKRFGSTFSLGHQFSAVLAGTALAVAACASDEGGNDGALTTTPTQSTTPAGTTTSSGPPATTSTPTVAPPATTASIATTSTSGPTTGPTASTSGTPTATGNTAAGPTGAGPTGQNAAGGASGMGPDAAAGGAGGMGPGATGSAGGMGPSATGGAGGMGTGGNGPSGDEDIDMTGDDFGCIAEWDKVSGFRINNLLGHLPEALEVANSASGGEYPVGTVLQHLPTEAMVKRREGFSPETGDWEFFLLQVNGTTTTISERGTTEIQTSMGQTCISCHSMVAPEFDLVCNTWADNAGGNCGFNFDDAMLDMQINNDSRCQ